MAFKGWFDGELRPDAWFDAELHPAGWFDTEIVDTGSAPSGVSASGSVGSTADVKVSWIEFDSSATPCDVKVSWLEFDTQETPCDVKVSWIEFNSDYQQALASLGGAPERIKRKNKPDEDESEVVEALPTATISRIQNEFLSESLAQDLINRARKRKSRAEEEALLLIL